jgi:multicomponent Na+:H+ antiporter subunit C
LTSPTVIDQFFLYGFVGVVLFSIGLYGLVLRAHLLRKIVALNVMGAAVFLFLAAVARRNQELFPDPVPHAMVLTGIVVAVSISAFALSLARRIHRETGSAKLPEGERE